MTSTSATTGEPSPNTWQQARRHAAKASELLASAPGCHCGDPENCPYEIPQASIAALASAHATAGLLYAAIGQHQSGDGLPQLGAMARHLTGYVAPFTPAGECDHAGPRCSRCCPCAACGSIRAAEVLAGEHGDYVPTVADTGGDPGDTSPDPAYRALARVRAILADRTLGASGVIELIGQTVDAVRTAPEARAEPSGSGHA